MNQTRVEWAQYGCLPVYGLNLEMYLLAVATLILTSMFYLYARLSQKPRDARILEGPYPNIIIIQIEIGIKFAFELFSSVSLCSLFELSPHRDVCDGQLAFPHWTLY